MPLFSAHLSKHTALNMFDKKCPFLSGCFLVPHTYLRWEFSFSLLLPQPLPCQCSSVEYLISKHLCWSLGSLTWMPQTFSMYNFLWGPASLGVVHPADVAHLKARSPQVVDVVTVGCIAGCQWVKGKTYSSQLSLSEKRGFLPSFSDIWG